MVVKLSLHKRRKNRGRDSGTVRQVRYVNTTRRL